MKEPMRRVHEVSLVVGVAALLALVCWPTLPSPHLAPFIVSIVSVPFIISTACAIVFTVCQSEAALPSRTAASYFMAAAGVAFMTIAGINDLWTPLPHPARFAIGLAVMCILFAVPWLISEFRVVHRSPMSFDAALVPFLALTLFQVTGSGLHLEMFWDHQFWVILGLPAVLITYIAMRRAVRGRRSTAIPFGAAAILLYTILRGTYGVVVR